MPEPVTTAAIVGVLAYFLAEKAAGKAGEKLIENAGSLWDKCKEFLQGDEIITLFPRAHSVEDVRAELETKLEEKFVAEPSARAEFEELFAQLPQEIKHNVINITGDNSTAIQDVHGSTITINK